MIFNLLIFPIFRFSRLLIFGGVGCFFAFVSCIAFAETIPATVPDKVLRYNVSTPWGWGYSPEGGVMVYKGVTPAQACQDSVWRNPVYTNGNIVSGECWAYYNGTNYSFATVDGKNVCPDTNKEGTCLSSCPVDQGWTLNGSTCTRPDCPVSEFRRSDGVCAKDCSGKTGQSPPSPNYTFDNDGGEPTVGGCVVRCKTWTSSSGAMIPDRNIGSGCTYTGVAPLADGTSGVGFTPPTKNEPKTPEGCLASGQGFVTSGSGTTTCVSSGDAPPDNKPVIKSESEKVESPKNNPDGSPDPNAPGAVTTDKTTITENGKTTTKTTETTSPVNDDEGNPVCPSGFTLTAGKCVKTTTTTEETSDFCTKNPSAPACIADKKKADDACIENPDRVGCVDLGTPPDEAALTTTPSGLPSSISVIGFASNASCPADIALPRGASLSFRWSCDMASALKPVLLALAWLASGLIVMGAFKNG